MQAWKRVFILLTLQCIVEEGTKNNLTIVITQSMMQQGGLTKEEVGERFICFGVDGASLFLGCHVGMTPQLKEKHSLYMMGQHCMAHKTNLAMQVLSNLAIVSKLKDLFQFVYAYFSSSTNCNLEFIALAKIMEIGGFKTFKNVKTQWILMLELLKHVLVAYKTLIVKMSQDNINVA